MPGTDRVSDRVSDTVSTRTRRGGAVLAGLLLAHVVLTALLAPYGLRAHYSGDEFFYLHAARSLSDGVRAVFGPQPVQWHQLSSGVVGNGWFMPGMPLVLTPLFLVDPHAGLTAVRLYLVLVNLVLLVAVVLVVRRVLGDLYAGALLVCPGLVPMWVLFSFTSFGDLPAGLVAVLVLTCLVTLARRLRVRRPPSVALGAALGAAGIVCLYLRSSSSPLVALALTVMATTVLVLLRGRARLRGLVSVAVAVAVVAVVLAPWSVAASRTFDQRVLTTTSVPLSLAVAFGHPDEICYGPCPGDDVWSGAVRYSREVAVRTGLGELQVQSDMSRYARHGLTLHGYAHDVLGDFGRYLFEPSAISARFRTGRVDQPLAVAVVVTDAVYGAGLVALALLAVGLTAALARRRSGSTYDDQVLGLLVTLVAAALMVQPFLHPSHGRYWPVFAPLLGLAAALLVGALRPRSEGSESPTPQPRLAIASGALGVVVVLIGVALLGLGVWG